MQALGFSEHFFIKVFIPTAWLTLTSTPAYLLHSPTAVKFTAYLSLVFFFFLLNSKSTSSFYPSLLCPPGGQEPSIACHTQPLPAPSLTSISRTLTASLQIQPDFFFLFQYKTKHWITVFSTKHSELKLGIRLSSRPFWLGLRLQ